MCDLRRPLVHTLDSSIKGIFSNINYNGDVIKNAYPFSQLERRYTTKGKTIATVYYTGNLLIFLQVQITWHLGSGLHQL